MFPTSAELQACLDKLESVREEMLRFHNAGDGKFPCQFLTVGSHVLHGIDKLERLLETAKFVERSKCNLQNQR